MKYKLSALAVDTVLFFWQRIPGLVIHNLAKARTLKTIFWHLNVDGLPGDYVEFGVAQGHSMRAAEIAERTSFSKQINVVRIYRNLYGFDTYTHFESPDSIDVHPTWVGSKFTASLRNVQKRFKKNPNIFLIKMDANELVSYQHLASNFGVKGNAAILLFDMDLYAPTLAALKWSYQIMQPGTFLIFDEFFSFQGDSSKGEAKALSDFLQAHPDVTIRDFCEYGAGGKVFIIDSLGKSH